MIHKILALARVHTKSPKNVIARGLIGFELMRAGYTQKEIALFLHCGESSISYGLENIDGFKIRYPAHYNCMLRTITENAFLLSQLMENYVYKGEE